MIAPRVPKPHPGPRSTLSDAETPEIIQMLDDLTIPTKERPSVSDKRERFLIFGLTAPAFNLTKAQKRYKKITPATAENKALVQRLNKVLKDQCVIKDAVDGRIFGERYWTGIMVSRNMVTKLHFDGFNIGPSYMFTTGDWKSGGHLMVETQAEAFDQKALYEPRRGQERMVKLKFVDCRNEVVAFKAAEVLHGTQQFEGGNRYCVTFFSLPFEGGWGVT